MSREQRRIQKQLSLIRSIDPAGLMDPRQRFEHGIKDLAAGGVFRLDGRTFLVEAIGTYTETDDTYSKTLDWRGHELKAVALETGMAHNLEWEEDDEIEVSLTTEEIKMARLAYDDGEPVAADSDDLDEIVEKGWDVSYGDVLFHYEDDYAAVYRRGGDGESREKVYFYEFEADDGTQLTIETWIVRDDREDFQVFLSRAVDPEAIEVLATGQANHA